MTFQYFQNIIIIIIIFFFLYCDSHYLQHWYIYLHNLQQLHILLLKSITLQFNYLRTTYNAITGATYNNTIALLTLQDNMIAY